MKLFEFLDTRKTALDHALLTAISKLEKFLSVHLIKVPGVEQFHNSVSSGYGIRFIANGSAKSIRINWVSGTGNVDRIDSIDCWLGNQRDPNFHITWRGSFDKALATIAGAIKNPKIGRAERRGDDSVIHEAKSGEWTPKAALDDFIKWMAKSPAGLGKTDFIRKYHIENVMIYDTIVHDYADSFEMLPRGRITTIKARGKNAVDYEKLKRLILSKADIQVTVTAGGNNETREDGDSQIPQTEKVPYVESMDHLKGLVQGLIKGSFNALFVAGRGGTGKTQTVEDTLSAAGLSDGHGYYKNTGTASAAGMYRLLYKHRENIILFDDSDGALNDQDGRNLIKAATDTKKVRKLAWNKATEMTDEEGKTIPKDFEFEGRIIFISNLGINKLDPDGALRTRAFVIAVDPTPEEMIDFMEKIVDKIELEDGLSLTKKQRREVLDVIRNSKRRNQATLRTLVRGLNLAASGADNWKRLIELYA
jgi:hypothetical protein